MGTIQMVNLIWRTADKNFIHLWGQKSHKGQPTILSSLDIFSHFQIWSELGIE